jgi:hypothetical protein
MTKLKHLNLSNCGNVTNKSAASIGSLLEIETLSLEGARAVDDVGFGFICNQTRLNLLNITGCSISRKSLMAVIKALGYVEESPHFFGFLIRNSDAKVSALRDRANESLRYERNQAAHTLQVSPCALYWNHFTWPMY